MRMQISTSKQHSCVRGPLWECRLIRSGASGLSYHCAQLVCVSDVIEFLAVWRHNKPKPKKHTSILFLYMYVRMASSNTKKKKSEVQCGSAFEPGASGLPYYSTCVRSWCNWRASCVGSKPKKKVTTVSLVLKVNLTGTQAGASFVSPMK